MPDDEYSGHGNPRELSHELVLKLADFSSFSSPNLPLWITAACDVNPFDMMEDNIGERAVLNRKGLPWLFTEPPGRCIPRPTV